MRVDSRAFVVASVTHSSLKPLRLALRAVLPRHASVCPPMTMRFVIPRFAKTNPALDEPNVSWAVLAMTYSPG